jgi:hypothetical protein
MGRDNGEGNASLVKGIVETTDIAAERQRR